MSRSSSPLSVVLPTLSVLVLAVLLMVEGRSRAKEAQAVAAQVSGSMKVLEKKLEHESGELRTILRRLQKNLDNVSRPSSGPSIASKAEVLKEEKKSPAEGDAPASAENEKENLPPLPAGVDAVLAIKDLNVEEFFDNPNYNPQQVTPTRLDILKAMNEVTAARANMEILNNEVQLAVAKGMEDLKASGNFVDYEPGQRPEAVEGVISAGEPKEGGGMRMYYLDPQEFPEIYTAKTKANEIAEVAFRRLLSMVNA